jgi:hypothetical protein
MSKILTSPKGIQRKAWLRQLMKRSLLDAPLSLGLPLVLGTAANHALTLHGCGLGETCAQPLTFLEFLTLVGMFVIGIPLIASFVLLSFPIHYAFQFLGIAFSVPWPGSESMDGSIALAFIGASVIQIAAGGLFIQLVHSSWKKVSGLGQGPGHGSRQNGQS